MIKKLLSLTALFSAMVAGAQTGAQTFTAVYNFASSTPSTGVTDPTAVPQATGLTFGSFKAVGTPSANPNASGRFSFVGWPTGATTTVDTYSTMTGSINLNQYYEVVLTPQMGYTVALNNLTFSVERSGAGIRSYVVRTSVDGFVNNLPASVGTSTALSVVGTNEFFWIKDANSSSPQNGSTITLMGATITSSVALRFYAWNSETTGGTFSIDNVTIIGSANNGSTTTSVKEANNETMYTIYPNPTSNMLNVKLEKLNAGLATIEITDVLGKMVLSKTMTENNMQLNVSDFTKGIYFINIINGSKSFNQKVIID